MALKRMMTDVWSYVADDTETAFSEPGSGKLTNTVAYEIILDASRLETQAAKSEEDKQVLAEFRKLAWSTQVRKARELLGRLV